MADSKSVVKTDVVLSVTGVVLEVRDLVLQWVPNIENVVHNTQSEIVSTSKGNVELRARIFAFFKDRLPISPALMQAW
jgi:hypothetical protein